VSDGALLRAAEGFWWGDMPARWSKWETAHTQGQTSWTNGPFMADEITVVIEW
jgi:hypothetical protein